MGFVRLLPSLWPAVLCWACIALPSLAWSSYRLTHQDELVWPWWFRAFTWLVVHTWPYTKIARMGAVFAQRQDERRAQRLAASCSVCHRIPAKVLELQHVLDHFPGEDEAWDAIWWRPPTFKTQEEADRWLAAREATGEDFWE